MKESINKLKPTNQGYSSFNQSFKGFPYKTRIWFGPLLDYLKERASQGKNIQARIAQSIVEEVSKAKELSEPIRNIGILVKNHQLVELMMSSVFPVSRHDHEIAAAFPSFSLSPFFSTPRYVDMMKAEEKKVNFAATKDPENIQKINILSACSVILNTFYGTNLRISNPFIFSVKDAKTGLFRHYKSDLNVQYTSLVAVKPLKKLSKKEIMELTHNLYDIDLWLEKLPPENFEFHGFVILNFIEVTEEETLSALKHSLLNKDAIITEKHFTDLQEHIKVLFREPGLKLGLSSTYSHVNKLMTHGGESWNNFIKRERNNELTLKDFQNTIYGPVFENNEIVIIEDLKNIKETTYLEKAILKKGIRSIVLAPLLEGDEIIGMLELGSEQPGAFNQMFQIKVENILALFEVAVRRLTKDIDNEVEAIIKEKCTSIHPSVNWRFREAALELLEQKQQGNKADMPSILFKDVFPLYGQIDIKGSTKARNKAIQVDLLENLQMVRNILEKAMKRDVPYPLADELDYRVGILMEEIRTSLSSSDERRVIEFLTQEVNPVLNHLRTTGKGMKIAILGYQMKLEQEMGIIYSQRAAYETSVTKINNVIGDFIDKEQIRAQLMVPHYFEKYKTDGVEYNLYVGQSLQNKGLRFDRVMLKNIRLWQLVMMCKATSLAMSLKEKLPMPLETTQLILVHSAPLTIRFRPDEKQFDVEGSYNIRYQIMKKRIDKALIGKTDERLTQPNKIAIVYAQPNDADEYLTYISYLRSKGYIKGEVEMLELDEMQGIQGLKALRVGVAKGILESD